MARHAPDVKYIRKNSILFLTTYGGDAVHAYKIARFLQITSDRFYLCVPSVCKSAGTLIALGANEIYMPVTAELGPLDIQLWRRNEIDQLQSGMVVRTALDGLADETYKIFKKIMLQIISDSRENIGFEVASRVASTIATGVMTPVYQQIDPESLGNDLRDLSIATAYGERLLDYSKNTVKGTLRKLVEEYPSHNFIIDREEAKKLFLNIIHTTPEMDTLISEMGDVVYSVQYPHFVSRISQSLTQKEEDPNVKNTRAEAGPQEDPKTGNDGDTQANMDQGCQTTGRSDHQGRNEEEGRVFPSE